MQKALAPMTLILTLTFVLSPLVTAPFTGFRPDQLPIPQINPPVQPAGYAFAILGLIYGWLLVSAVYGIWKRRDDVSWGRSRMPLIASLALGTPWLAIANVSATWATVAIFAIAVTAILALVRAPESDRAFLAAPLGLYAGWLTAASFVSLGSTAAGYGLITGADGWAHIGIIGALVVTLPVLVTTRSMSYGATVIWALVGIIVANGLELWTVSVLAATGIAIIAAQLLRQNVNGRSAASSSA